MRPKRARKPTISNRWFSGNFSLALTLADLATVTRNVMAINGAPEASFVLYPQLTPVQDRAFQLLDIGVKV